MPIAQHQPDERLGDEPAADRSQYQRGLIPFAAELLGPLHPFVLGLGKDVVPERRVSLELLVEGRDLRVVLPVLDDRLPDPEIVVIDRLESHGTGDRLAAGQTERHPAQQVAHREIRGLEVRVDRIGLELLDRQRRRPLDDGRELRQESQRIDERCVDLYAGWTRFVPTFLMESLMSKKRLQSIAHWFGNVSKPFSPRPWTPAKMKNRPARPRAISAGVAAAGSSPP